MALGKDYTGQNCALARALELVGERWTMLILRDAFYGVRRYKDFHSHVGAPRAVLAERLQALTEAGVFEKRQYQDAPPRYEYVLTDAGECLWPAVHTLSRWGDEFIPYDGGVRRAFVHADCGERLDAVGNCPSCRLAVPPREVEMRPGPGTERDSNEVGRALQEPRRLLTPVTP
ncbi:winged helix-turn-helix transcriptional regulator [Solicola gregarius]|uniref:Helix-turn-helix transcriptional regulator n=1 Tax=Solicola gregarius TaxID=2908642 RepID=A0AA46TLW4_9ACTN|nr:helix-turn-helix domain-containing protein [Solicola gregarius]UYM07719.1 helix-turn-helix transcriptional regulator [Solicola gregarius]